MQLTVEQKDALKSIVSNLDKDQYQTLGGYAGTGKSTISKVLMDVFERKKLFFSAGAYTGKAANVLRKKGLEANTIHSLIYKPIKDANTNEVYWEKASKYDIISSGINGFLIDEASMVSREIHEDLMSYELPIIYIGDHGQLEPIGTGFNLMKNPMYKLEEIHRNAGEIAHFAHHLRQGKFATDFVGKSKVQVLTNEKSLEDKHLASVDQVICAFNKTRVQLNERVRKERNIQYTYIAKGEKIICLRNNRRQGLFNGMQCVVTRVRKNDRFDFTSDNTHFENIKYDPDQFGKLTNENDYSQEVNLFDYAYAITAHKAQGDEFGSVIAYEQRCNNWDHVRWSYTVASRAKSSIIWLAHKTYRPSYL